MTWPYNHRSSTIAKSGANSDYSVELFIWAIYHLQRNSAAVLDNWPSACCSSFASDRLDSIHWWMRTLAMYFMLSLAHVTNTTFCNNEGQVFYQSVTALKFVKRTTTITKVVLNDVDLYISTYNTHQRHSFTIHQEKSERTWNHLVTLNFSVDLD